MPPSGSGLGEEIDVFRRSAVELAALIRAGRLSSRAVVDAHIAQIQRFNPTLNAVVHDRFTAARAEADAADDRVAAGGDLPPLLGVPCTIKECFGIEGLPQSSGLWARRACVAERDAVVVERIRAAGAIPLGLTNTSELCMWMESNNPVYGRTNNPYDVKRIVGGSSGGEAAAVAAGGAPFGLGSDIGGSIRMPAFFNGVFGHKPSGGLVPGTGQYPCAENEAQRYLCTGPLTRYAADLMPITRILAGPDGEYGCVEYDLGDPDAVDIASLRVLDVAGTGKQPVARDLRRVQAQVAQALRAAGAAVEPRTFSKLKRSFDMWSCSMHVANDVSFRDLMGQGAHVSPRRELVKWALRRSDFTAISSILAITEGVVDRFPGYRDQMLRLRDALKAELHAALADDGVMLFPSYAFVAPKHNAPFVRQLMLRFDFAFTAILNIMELPVTQVPLGLNRRGLPLGIQVAAAPGNDHLTIAVAQHLERVFGGWSPPRRWLG